MRSKIQIFLSLSLFFLAAACLRPSFAQEKAPLNSPLVFKMPDIDGKPVDLAVYKGKVVLLVNTASKCGFTPQYEALQAVYDKYKARGFTVLAFPANNFRDQEPGTNEEIKSFCSLNYNVTFPLFSKVSVKGEDICPLYKYLTSGETNPGFAGEIPWNFTKFLLDRQGRVAARFEPRTKPDDQAVIEAIEKALAQQ
ncbi:MAG TPA: glutathione peroxidase [archaeon]|nr:glutathione peroxidase [archaeon]